MIGGELSSMSYAGRKETHQTMSPTPREYVGMLWLRIGDVYFEEIDKPDEAPRLGIILVCIENVWCCCVVTNLVGV
jgi:hypothetical protein